MKLAILAAGEGRRLKDCYAINKALTLINGKRLIEYSLDLAYSIKAFIDEIIIIVGYNHDAVIDSVGYEYKGIKISYVVQNERKGIAHAMKTAKDKIDDDVIMCLADEILINPNLEDMVKEFFCNKPACLCGIIYDDMNTKALSYTLNEKGNIIKAIEKPTGYKNSIRGVGECIFSKEALSYLDTLKPNSLRNEYEMGDWIQSLIDDGKLVSPFKLADNYYNVNTPRDIDETKEAL